MSDGRASVLEARISERSSCPIRDYAFIGDCHGAALVASDGSVDWCCLGRFDAEPAVWRLLDAAQGGFFEIAAIDAVRSTRAYLPDTNILQTIHDCTSGRVAVTDFMPVDHAPAAPEGDFVTLRAALINSAIHLHLHGTGGVGALAGTHADRTLRARSLQEPVSVQR